MTQRLIAVLMTFFLAGCALFGKPPSLPMSKEASSLVETLRQTNKEMTSFKGIGKFQFSNPAQSVSARAVWVCADSERFRIEILGISGRPDQAMACDGKWLYLLSKADKRLYKQRLADGDLSRMISIGIKPRELVSLLAGRTPIPEYSFAELWTDPVQGPVLSFKKGKHAVERVFFSDDMKSVFRIERYDPGGALLFQAAFETMKTIDGHRVPERLSIFGADAGLVLTIERYWTFANISPEMFELKNLF